MAEMTDAPFTLRATGKRLGALKIAALALGLCVPPALWLGWRPQEPEAYAIIGTTAALFLFADFAAWFCAGIRELRIDADTITATTGWRRRQRVVRARDITELHASETLGRRELQILLGAPASTVRGVFTFYPWPKIRLVSDPFDPAEAISRIQALVARAQQPPPAPAAENPAQTPRDH